MVSCQFAKLLHCLRNVIKNRWQGAITITATVIIATVSVASCLKMYLSSACYLNLKHYV